MEIKRNLKSLENKTGEKIKNKIESMLSNHEKYKSCYFWSSTGNASSRRRQEFEDELSFVYNGIKYDWRQSLDISCKNFYWTSSISKNGKKSNVKVVKGLI